MIRLALLGWLIFQSATLTACVQNTATSESREAAPTPFNLSVRLTQVAATTAATSPQIQSVPVKKTFVVDGREVTVEWQSHDQRFRADCDPDTTIRLFERFFKAFNQGDSTELGKLFFGTNLAKYAQPAERYGVVETGNPEKNFATSDLEDLLIYFNQRHLQHERLTLLNVRMSSWGTSGVTFGFTLLRTADDLSYTRGIREGRASGKGVMDCETQKFAAWIMSMDKE